MRRRRWAGLAAALALVGGIGFAGCGTDNGSTGYDTSSSWSFPDLGAPAEDASQSPSEVPSDTATEDATDQVPADELIYGDVIQYLQDQGYSDADFSTKMDDSIDSTVTAIDGERRGSPAMRADRQAWLDAGWSNDFVDTLYDYLFDEGWAEPWTEPSVTDGVWTVGVDIPAGTYRSDGDIASQGYWEITRGGSNGTDIIANDIVTGGHPTVTLEAGQVFKTTDCGTWTKTG